MDVHLPSWQEIIALLVRFPVVLVLVGGVIFGAGLTQFIKKGYLDWSGPLMDPVSHRRYRFTIRVLSAVSTYAFTLWLWHVCLGHGNDEEVVCVGTALLSPLIYDGVRALVKWKWPGFAAHWGDVNDGK